MRWAREHSKWSGMDWRAVLWSDESRASLEGPDGAVKIWRKKHERFNPDCLVQKPHHPKGIMVWGCFSWYGLGPLIIIEGMITGATYSKLLEAHVMPTMLVMFDGMETAYFQHDNAPLTGVQWQPVISNP